MNYYELEDIVRAAAYAGKKKEDILPSLSHKIRQLTDEEAHRLRMCVDDFIIDYQLASQEKSKVIGQAIAAYIIVLFGSLIGLMNLYSTGAIVALLLAIVASAILLVYYCLDVKKQPIRDIARRIRNRR